MNSCKYIKKKKKARKWRMVAVRILKVSKKKKKVSKHVPYFLLSKKEQ